MLMNDQTFSTRHGSIETHDVHERPDIFHTSWVYRDPGVNEQPDISRKLWFYRDPGVNERPDISRKSWVYRDPRC